MLLMLLWVFLMFAWAHSVYPRLIEWDSDADQLGGFWPTVLVSLVNCIIAMVLFLVVSKWIWSINSMVLVGTVVFLFGFGMTLRITGHHKQLNRTMETLKS
jgi:hypothetical protein